MYISLFLFRHLEYVRYIFDVVGNKASNEITRVNQKKIKRS